MSKPTDPELMHLLTQATDLPAFQIPALLEKLREHFAVEPADPASDTAEVEGLCAELRTLRDDMRKELADVPARIEEALAKLTERLADLEELNRAADRRLETIEKARAARAAAPAAKPAAA